MGYTLFKNAGPDMRLVGKYGGWVSCASGSDQVRKMSGGSIPCG